MAEHQTVKAIVICKGAENFETETLLIEGEQGLQIIRRAGDAQMGFH